jgi:glycosyltransferase involved in cell wall biosynthesis
MNQVKQPMIKRPSIVATLMGNVHSQTINRTKYGYFFDALSKECDLVDVLDAGLEGFQRWFNALMFFHRSRAVWRERFYKNIPAFRLRSRKANALLWKYEGKADVSMQIGVMYDSAINKLPFPHIIYSDYTAILSSRKPHAGRSPFTKATREKWIALEKKTFERAVHVCTRSELVKQSLLEDYDIPQSKVTVIGGGLNLASLPEIPARWDHPNPLVLFIGKEFQRKGGPLLVKAFSMVRQVLPSARLTIVTSHVPDDVVLPENTHVLTHIRARSEIENLYRAADVFVLPSVLETWGDVIIEAMAFGLPCIGVREDAMPEIIQHEKTGFLIARQDAISMADAMVMLLKNAALRKLMGNEGRSLVEKEFLWSHVVKRLKPVLDKVSCQSNAAA